MTEKVLEIDQTPDDGSETIVGKWEYHCTVCKAKRCAHMFKSGHVIDLEAGQNPDDIKNILVVEAKGEKTFKNMYFVPEIAIDAIRTSPQGLASIKALIGKCHAKMFHADGNVRMIANS